MYSKILFLSVIFISVAACQPNTPAISDKTHTEGETSLPPIREDSNRYTPPKEMSVNHLKDTSLLQKTNTRPARQLPLSDSKNPLSGNYANGKTGDGTRVWIRDGASEKELEFEYEIENSQIGCGNSLFGKAVLVAKNQYKVLIADLEGCQIDLVFDRNKLTVSSNGCNEYLGEPCGVSGELSKQKK